MTARALAVLPLLALAACGGGAVLTQGETRQRAEGAAAEAVAALHPGAPAAATAECVIGAAREDEIAVLARMAGAPDAAATRQDVVRLILARDRTQGCLRLAGVDLAG